MQSHEANFRSTSYCIAEMQARCAQCGRPSRVLAFVLPPNHEMLADGEWQTVDANALVFHIAGLPDTVSRHLLERFPDYCKTNNADPTEWANHCPHCGCVFGDDELHCEPGGFMPSSTLEAHGISLTRVKQAFSVVAAGYALDPEFFASIRAR